MSKLLPCPGCGTAPKWYASPRNPREQTFRCACNGLIFTYKGEADTMQAGMRKLRDDVERGHNEEVTAVLAGYVKNPGGGLQ